MWLFLDLLWHLAALAFPRVTLDCVYVLVGRVRVWLSCVFPRPEVGQHARAIAVRGWWF